MTSTTELYKEFFRLVNVKMSIEKCEICNSLSYEDKVKFINDLNTNIEQTRNFINSRKSNTMKKRIKQIFTAIILVTLFASCSKTESAPNPQFFTGNLLGFTVKKTVPTNPADTLNTGHIQSLVNGNDDGKTIKATIIFEDPNHVAFKLTIKAVDFEAHDYYFTVVVRSGINQMDTTFYANERIQVIGICQIN